MRATILGIGNIGIALAQGLVENGGCKMEEITLQKRYTIAGLSEMKYQGLSSAMIKGIKLSANIANNLYKSS